MAESDSAFPIRRVAFVGNYLPRRCGIATFTTDLCEAVARAQTATSSMAVPVNDIEGGYDYPARVRFVLEEKESDSYRRAADFLNTNSVDVVSLQHEYGIFGGRAGSHILALLQDLRTPIITTLHTVLRNPDPDQRRVLERIAALSDRLVVMSDRAVEFLQEVYDVPRERIDLIPHGIPDVPFVDPSFHKDQFGVEGKTVLLSFGLLSPNKGLEYMVSALPAILAQHPEVVYIILGATHPQVLRNDGESYRLSLQRLAEQKGVESHVIFYNRFVELEELKQFIGAADIYVTPYLEPEQIVSGTLAYTLGAGKAVVSTPYWYAGEMLRDDKGVLVPFRDSHALAAAINGLLDDDARRDAMRKRAYLSGRKMIWSQVADRYLESFERARRERHRFARPGFAVKPLDRRPRELPPLRLDHLHRLTDDTGILQHAVYTTPNYREGYTTDDNARALIVSALLTQLGHKEGPELARRYLAFLWNAFDPDSRTFRNFMGYQRDWLEARGSEDSHGRALWALGTVLGRVDLTDLQNLAGRMFQQALPGIRQTTSPRAWAFALLGIHEYWQRFAGDRRAEQVQGYLGGRLVSLYGSHSSGAWRWFEDQLAYCNAALPHALLVTGELLGRPDMQDAALQSLVWLADLQRADSESEHFVPIGTNGFFARGGKRARFDQQPVEAQAMVSACLEAYRITADERWRKEARRAFEWFLGRNDLNVPLYDPITGGCRDGLHPDRPNENEGAESTLAFLQSWAEIRLLEEGTRSPERGQDDESAFGVTSTPQAESHPVRSPVAVPSK